jgi:hypothetical protein
MRSSTAQAFISDLETEDIESFTDTALGEDLTELRRTMDRVEFQFNRRLDLFARRQGFHHAAVIAHSVTEVGAEAVVRQESTLLEAAAKLDPKLLSYVTRQIRHCEDPDGTLADANENTTAATCSSVRHGTACS